MAKRPLQMTSIDTFSARQWYTVNKDGLSLFPTLDRRQGETVAEALHNPLVGSQYDSVDSPYPGLNIIYKAVLNSVETDLLMARVSNTSFSVSSGKCLINGIYVETGTSTIIDLTDTDSFFDSTAFPEDHTLAANETYVVLYGPDADTGVFGMSVIKYSNFLLLVEYYEVTNNIALPFMIIGFFTTDASSYINTSNGILYTYGLYNRAPNSFEYLHDYDPLECGLIRHYDSTDETDTLTWATDWTVNDGSEQDLEIVPTGVF